MAETPLASRLQRWVARNGVGRQWCPLCHWSGHLKGQLGRYSTSGKASDTRQHSTPYCMWNNAYNFWSLFKANSYPFTFSWVARSNEATHTLDLPDFPVQKDESPFSLMDTFRLRPNTLFISQFAHFCYLQKRWQASKVEEGGKKASGAVKVNYQCILSPALVSSRVWRVAMEHPRGTGLAPLI